MSDVSNIATDVFDVSPNLISIGGGTPGLASGDTIVGISTDDVNFTPIPQDGSGAMVNGTYLSFTEDDTGDLTTSLAPGQTDQDLINLVNNNDSSTSPLSDSLYYEVQDSSGTVVTDQLVTDLGDVGFASPGTGAYADGGESVSNGSTIDIGGASISKATSSDGSYGGKSVDSYVLTATLGTFDFTNQAPDGTIAIDPTVSGGGGTVSYSSDHTTVTVTGTVSQINADFSTAQFTATQTGTDDIVITATDGPVPNVNEILGSLTIQSGTAEPITSSTSTIFTVTANGGGSGQGTPGFQSGDTIVGISTDDVNFTPVPSDGSTASVSGTYLTFTEDASGDLGTTVAESQVNQAVIDAINNNDGSNAPLSDSLYYELQDSQGNTTYDQYTFDLGDVSFDYPNTGAYTPNSGETVTQGSTINIGGPTVDKALSSDGTYGGKSVDSYVLTATLGTFDFANQAPDGTIAIDPTVSGGGGTVSYSSDGSTVSVTGTVGEINADFSTAQFTATQTGTDYIIITDTDGPVPTGNQIIGSITVEPTPPCYCPGTLILTDRGEVPVELLCMGSQVVTLAGLAPVTWIGSRRMPLAGHPQRARVQPIRIRAGAFGPGLPRRDLLVSPEHCVFTGEALVPARSLVGCTGIDVDTVLQATTYYHVELPQHAVMLAEGLPCESWLDTGNRGMFENAPVAALGFDEAIADPSLWASKACAPLLTSGAVLDALRARIGAPPPAMPFRLERPGRSALLVPAGVDLVQLVSAIGYARGDARPLGAAITAISLDGTPVCLADARLGRGFHAIHGACRWTDGAGHLDVGASQVARELLVDVTALSPAQSQAA